MPPPNVTGSLHMGHALTCTLEDALIRWHRMRGFNALWQPGIDHAGIATQTVVERQLAREGTTRHELGRDDSSSACGSGRTRAAGASRCSNACSARHPMARTKFTMDADMTAPCRGVRPPARRGAHVPRDAAHQLVPECQTALSDLEVENEEGANGELFEFAYKVDGEGREIVVATTRPETMLGDTAVAVHPDDPRYTHLHGKKLVHPFVDRKVPSSPTRSSSTRSSAPAP